MSQGHFAHLGDVLLGQMMFMSFKLQALATSRSPEISVTIVTLFKWSVSRNDMF